MPLPKITNVSSGSISINGRKYETDVVVFWDGEILERERSFVFSKRELFDILIKDPEVIILGTGFYDNVRVEQTTLDYIKLNNIEFISKPTKEASKEFNGLVRKKRVVAIFHISD